MKLNVEREADRLEFYSQHIINLATEYIWGLWDSRSSTIFQKSQFINLANNANNINRDREINRLRFINNSEIIDQIARINLPQVTSNPLENNFFNGTRFQDNNSFESLILPAGLYTSSFSFL